MERTAGEKGRSLGAWIRLIGGWALVLGGSAGLILPILPGVPMLLGGLALLAEEYVWARKARERLKGWIAWAREKFKRS